MKIVITVQESKAVILGDTQWGIGVEGLQGEGGIGPMASLWSEERFHVLVKIQLGK